MLPNAAEIVSRLIEFQAQVRDRIVATHAKQGLHQVARTSSADTIYAIDAEVEPILEAFCHDFAKTTPLVLIAEGIEDEHGREGPKVFPQGTREEDAQIRLIVDPIDGTRGIMYDKRPAWALAGVAPNKGDITRLRDIELAVMTELPTSKMGYADVLWAIKGQGAHGERVDLSDPDREVPLPLNPSRATTIAHGFAPVTHFFPATKRLAGELMEAIAVAQLGPTDVTQSTVFDDQYISTGGQFYELIVGHDRFNCDLRPLFYQLQNQPEGLCCHPYDVATLLIAEEAGIILTDGRGQPLDGPLDTTSGIHWIAYANIALREAIEPVIQRFFKHR